MIWLCRLSKPALASSKLTMEDATRLSKEGSLRSFQSGEGDGEIHMLLRWNDGAMFRCLELVTKLEMF